MRGLDAYRTLQLRSGIRGQGMGHRGKPAFVHRVVTLMVGVVLSLAAIPMGSAWAQVGSARYSAIIMDARTGKVMMGVNQDELRFPASLTKLMTLYMTFEALRDRRIQINQ